MRLDLLLTVLASVVIGWNLGSWLIPAVWLAVLCAAVFLASLPRLVGLGRASGNQRQALRA